MPQIRAEQVLELTLKDAQVAVDANIKQSKIEDWQSDPAGWISRGIIKPVTTAELPSWDGSQSGEFYYDMNTNELFFGISTDPYYQIIMGSSDGSGGSLSGSDKTIVLKMSTEAENWSGTDEFDVNGTASKFALDGTSAAADGSNVMLYLNGILQEVGSGNDFVIIEEQPRDSNGDLISGADPVDKIVFNYNLEGPDQKITAIINHDESLVNYATKAYVDQKFYGDFGHDHDGIDSNQLDFNTSMTSNSLSSIIHSIIPNSNAVDLGSSTNKFGNIYAESGHFDASTIYIGNVAISGLGDKLQASIDGGANYSEVPLSKNDNAPTEITAGTSQEVILESTVGITAKGNILPDMTGATGDISTRNIGSETQKFNSIYADEIFVGASSLYVNGKKVIQDVSDTMTFQTDSDQAMTIKTQSSTPGAGNGNLSIESQNEINILADGGFLVNIPLDVSNSQMNFINNSPGGNITFNAEGTNSQVQISAIDEIDLTAPTIDVSGNLLLRNPVSIVISGDASGSATFDGSSETNISVSVADDSHDHTTISGNSATTTKLATARTISLSGGVSGSTTFDGSANASIDVTVDNDGHNHDNRYYTETEIDTNFLNKSSAGTETMQGSLTVQGNLTVSGTTTTVNTEVVQLADNIITLNSNYTGSSPSEDSGIEVERGTLSNYRFMFNEATDTFVIGMSGDEQPVATREVTPSAGGLAQWNDTEKRFNTVDQGTLSVSYASSAGNADKLDNLNSTQFLRSDTSDSTSGNLTVGGDLTVNNSMNLTIGEGLKFLQGTVVGGQGNDGRIIRIQDTNTPTAPDGHLAITYGSNDSPALIVNGTTVDINNLTEGGSSTLSNNISGSASKLTTARTISLSGDVSGSTTFDGSSNVSITATVANNSHDHTSISGSASKLTTARTISLSGDVSGSTTFDGSSNVSITAAVANNSHSHTSANISDATDAATANTVMKRNSNGDVWARLFRSNYSSTNSDIAGIYTTQEIGADYLRPSTTGQLAAQMESDNVILKYNGGTAAAGHFYTGTTNPSSSNRLNYDGYFYATRVYNAVYNDLAEFMPKAEEAEAGQVMIMTENGIAPSKGRGEKAVVGVYSDTFGQALGADDQENKIPVGLSGRVNVWVEEPCEIGDLLISGDKPGFASVKKSSEDGEGKVIGKVMQPKKDSTSERVSMLIMMK